MRASGNNLARERMQGKDYPRQRNSMGKGLEHKEEMQVECKWNREYKGAERWERKEAVKSQRPYITCEGIQLYAKKQRTDQQFFFLRKGLLNAVRRMDRGARLKARNQSEG